VAVFGGLQYAAISTNASGNVNQSNTGVSCGITTAGAAYCWGYGGTGSLGNGGVANSSSPVAVSGSLTFQQVSSGGYEGSICGVTTSGAVYCWGDNASPAPGMLGNGTSTGQVTTPTLVSGSNTYASVAVGYNHVCALTTSGSVYCWGTNNQGQFGNGATTASYTPTLGAGGATFASLAVGDGSTCGLTAAGVVWCWGTGTDGQLGNGTTQSSQLTPVQVNTSATFVQITAGTAHYCGLTTANTVLCWGYGAWGQLGNGGTANATTPVAVSPLP
jgi:alpha-tubulin suppressor-like RCC1 family protein